MSSEGLRKAVHISMVAFALLVGRLSPALIVVACCGALVFNAWVLPILSRGALERNQDRERGFALGIVLYPAVLLLLSLVFYRQQVMLVVGWGAMAFGDGFAGLLGSRFGGPRISWNKEKGWYGTIAFWLLGIPLTTLLVLALPAETRLGLSALSWLAICAGALLVAGWLETLKGTIDDNLIVPIGAAFTAWVLTRLSGWPSLPEQWPVGLIAVLLLTVGSIGAKKIDVAGGLIGGLIAWCMFLGGGLGHLSLLFTFFVLGSLASHWRVADKRALGLAQEERGKRTIRHALANGGVAGCCALLGFLIPEHADLWLLMSAASLASATADTLSSELGNVYGRRFVNVLTLRPDRRGRDGVVSLEGSLFGGLGALLIAIQVAWFSNHFWGAAVVLAAGLLGNLCDSVLGATLQRRGYMTNDTVNAANTLAAALVVVGAFLLLV